MSLHDDLLRQAVYLAEREPRRPKQASLRRSVSASYYALYHLLVDSAVRRLVSGSDREALRDCLRRGFNHTTMKRNARQFASSNLSPALEPGLSGLPIPRELAAVADTFADLQEHRHAADYDLGRTFSRFEARSIAFDAAFAFHNWSSIRSTLQADVFLVGLLVGDRLRN